MGAGIKGFATHPRQPGDDGRGLRPRGLQRRHPPAGLLPPRGQGRQGPAQARGPARSRSRAWWTRRPAGAAPSRRRTSSRVRPRPAPCRATSWRSSTWRARCHVRGREAQPRPHRAAAGAARLHLGHRAHGGQARGPARGELRAAASGGPAPASSSSPRATRAPSRWSSSWPRPSPRRRWSARSRSTSRSSPERRPEQVREATGPGGSRPGTRAYPFPSGSRDSTVSLSPDQLKQLLADADHPLGVKELLRLAGLNPGQQTELKRALRELVRDGPWSRRASASSPEGSPVPTHRAGRRRCAGRAALPLRKATPRGSRAGERPSGEPAARSRDASPSRSRAAARPARRGRSASAPRARWPRWRASSTCTATASASCTR